MGPPFGRSRPALLGRGTDVVKADSHVANGYLLALSLPAAAGQAADSSSSAVARLPWFFFLGFICLIFWCDFGFQWMFGWRD
jgi:hypothetical protein